MEFNKAKAHYDKKKYGKCSSCSHGILKYVFYGNYRYVCKVRDEQMNNELACDWFKIKFCKYYELKKVEEENKNVKK